MLQKRIENEVFQELELKPKAANATVQITLSNRHDGTACATTAVALEEPHQAVQPFDVTSEVTQGQNKTHPQKEKKTGLCFSSSPNQYRVAKGPTPSSTIGLPLEPLQNATCDLACLYYT